MILPIHGQADKATERFVAQLVEASEGRLNLREVWGDIRRTVEMGGGEVQSRAEQSLGLRTLSEYMERRDYAPLRLRRVTESAAPSTPRAGPRSATTAPFADPSLVIDVDDEEATPHLQRTYPGALDVVDRTGAAPTHAAASSVTSPEGWASTGGRGPLARSPSPRAAAPHSL